MPTIQEVLAQQRQAAEAARNAYQTGGFGSLFSSGGTPFDISSYQGTLYNPLGAATSYTPEQRSGLINAGIPLQIGETNRWYYNGNTYPLPGGSMLDILGQSGQNNVLNSVVGLGAGSPYEQAWAAGQPTPPLTGTPQPTAQPSSGTPPTTAGGIDYAGLLAQIQAMMAGQGANLGMGAGPMNPVPTAVRAGNFNYGQAAPRSIYGSSIKRGGQT